MDIFLSDLAPTFVFLVVLAIVLVWLGIRAHSKSVMTGNEGMIGLTGIVKERKGFRNRSVVEVRGELWWCRSSHRLEPGMEVRVRGLDDLMLDVEPVNGSAPSVS